jgi:hypothetical protein
MHKLRTRGGRLEGYRRRIALDGWGRTRSAKLDSTANDHLANWNGPTGRKEVETHPPVSKLYHEPGHERGVDRASGKAGSGGLESPHRKQNVRGADIGVRRAGVGKARPAGMLMAGRMKRKGQGIFTNCTDRTLAGFPRIPQTEKAEWMGRGSLRYERKYFRSLLKKRLARFDLALHSLGARARS